MIRAKEIHKIVGGVLIGDPDVTVHKASPIDAAEEGSLTFCTKRDSNAFEAIESTRASVIICSSDLDQTALKKQSVAYILVEKPRKSMVLVMAQLFLEKRTGISPQAFIQPGATIDPTAFIGPFCYIGKSVIIGKNVIVQAGTVIGEDGFGFERDDDGSLIRFPHIGGVVIEDDVEIGANVCIDKGTLGNTVIAKGTKIDNLCHIAHNVQIGRHCMITAQSTMAGSSKIGDYSTMAPNSCLREKVAIGNNVLIGLGAVVTKDIEDGWIAFGVPAKPMRKVERTYPLK
jgi:UDP-3-O-[3-hydroxymyristoyl] glucosamine N-acyltransferase